MLLYLARSPRVSCHAYKDKWNSVFCKAYTYTQPTHLRSESSMKVRMYSTKEIRVHSQIKNLLLPSNKTVEHYALFLVCSNGQAVIYTCIHINLAMFGSVQFLQFFKKT